MRCLEKAELHAHLNGCIPPSKTKELVKKYGITLPRGFDLDKDLQIKEPVSSLLEYFRPWFIFKLLPLGRDCLREMVDAAIESLAMDNVKYAELRKNPFNICDLNKTSLEVTLEWLIDALCVCSQKYGIDARLIVSLSRYHNDLEKARELICAIKNVNYRSRIVGLDLSGDEDKAINCAMSKFYRAAKEDLGLGITIHAGETGNVNNLCWAITECHADRIGHGLAAAESTELLDKIQSSSVCLEVCLSSSFLTGIVKRESPHPVQTFIDLGIPFVLCSDNPQINNACLSDEYELFLTMTSRDDILEEMYGRQMSFSFKDRG